MAINHGDVFANSEPLPTRVVVVQIIKVTRISVKYIVPSRIITTTKGDRDFSTVTACRAIASRQDLRNRSNEARKNAQATKMHGIQAISVDLSGGGIAGHPGHAIPRGDGITPRDVMVALTKQA